MSDLFVAFLNASVEKQALTALFAMIVLGIVLALRRS